MLFAPESQARRGRPVISRRPRLGSGGRVADPDRLERPGGRDPVVGMEPLHPVAAHEPGQDLGIGLEQVNQDEPVHTVAEIRVHVEADDLAAQLEVLLEQHRYGPAVLHVAHEVGHVLGVVEHPGGQGEVQPLQAFDLGRPLGQGHVGHLGQGTVALHEADDELPGDHGIFAGDGDAAEEPVVARVADHELGQPLPEHEQRLVAALVFGNDKGAAQLQGGSEAFQESGSVVEQGGGVQPVRPLVGHDLVGQGEAVRPGHLALLVVPEYQVAVGVVESVDVHGPARALAHLAEGLLAADADLAQQPGDLIGRGVEHGEFGIVQQDIFVRQAGHLGGEDMLAARIGDGVHAPLGLAPLEVEARLALAAQQVGAETQVVDHALVAVELGQLVLADDRAQAHADDVARGVLQVLVRQKHGAQPGVDQPEGLEQAGVAAVKEDRQGRGPGLADDPPDHGTPARVAHAALLDLQAGHLARREDHQHAAVLEPAHGGLESGNVLARGLGPAKGVHLDDQVVHLRDHAEHEVGHDLDVRADLAQDAHQKQPLEHAEGMVAHRDQRPGARHPADGLAVHRKAHPEQVHGLVHETAVALPALQGRIERVQRVESEHFGQRALDHGKKGVADRVVEGRIQIEQRTGKAIFHFLPPDMVAGVYVRPRPPSRRLHDDLAIFGDARLATV